MTELYKIPNNDYAIVNNSYILAYIYNQKYYY